MGTLLNWTPYFAQLLHFPWNCKLFYAAAVSPRLVPSVMFPKLVWISLPHTATSRKDLLGISKIVIKTALASVSRKQ